MSAPPSPQPQQHHQEQQKPQPTARAKQLQAKIQALQVAAAELRSLKPERAVYQRVGGGIFLRAPGKDAAAKRVAEDTRRAEAELRREEDERRRQLEQGLA